MFRDVSECLADNAPMRGYGAAVTSGPRGLLVFVCGYGDPNRLYRADGSKVSDVACGILADDDRHAIAAAAADLDADGAEEVYVHNTDTYGGRTVDPDLLLDRTSANESIWQDVFTLEVNEDRANFRSGRSIAAIDRLGTGQYGVAIASYGSALRYYELGDDGQLTDMAPALGLDIVCGGRSLIAAPLVTDRMDLYLGVDSGPNRLFRNERGHFTDVAGEFDVVDSGGAARGTAVLTVPGDSLTSPEQLELAVDNWERSNRIFRRTEDSFVDVAPTVFSEPTRSRTLVAADFDNDGQVELFRNCLAAPNELFRRTVADDWTELDPGAASEPTGLGTGAVVVDIDDDGILELFIVHGELAAQPVSVYKASTDNDWLRVAPQTAAGAPARGAVVALETDAGTQQRIVDAGSNYLCQSEPVAHFGLGHADPQRVHIRWPGGHETTISTPDSCVRHEVPHPATE